MIKILELSLRLVFIIFFLQEEVEDEAAESLLPTKGWNKVQKLHFARIRDQITDLRTKYTAQTIECDDLPSEDCPEEWLDYCRSNSPLLSIMFRVPQRTLEAIIEYQANWLKEFCEPDQLSWLSSWIYASLACLRLPLEPNMHNVLRCISKCCIRMRNQLLPNDTESAVPMNLLICIISRNFNQLDLCGKSV